MPIERITGMFSGLDVDSLVSKMMKAERAPINKLKQQKQTLTWQREAYRDINSKVLDFRNNKLHNYRLEGTYLSKKVSVTGNASAVSAKPSGTALNGTLAVQVDSLATAASNFSSGDIRKVAGDTTFDPNQSLASQAAKFADTAFDPNDNAYKSITINGKTINFDPITDSLNSVIAKINKETNVTAFYDGSTGQVSFMSKETGTVNGSPDGKDITFAGKFLTDTLKVTTANAVKATDASVTVNGMLMTSKSNTLTVNGVSITLNQSGGPVAVLNISNDTDKIIESIKSFINDYNEILKVLNDKIGESRYRDFLPLTDEQKKEMKEKDIELWEEKAKSGLLKNDGILSKAIFDMRLSISAQVETGSNKYKTLSSIGIETGSYTEKGKLFLVDEDKLRAVIEEDPEAVKNIFAGSGNGDNDRSDIGIAKRMYDDFKVAMDNITKKVGSPSYQDSTFKDNSMIGKQLYYLGREIDNRDDRLKDIENRYYRKFSAMETAISRYSSQSSFLMNQFGGK